MRDVPGAAGLPRPGGGYGDHRAGPAARDGAGPIGSLFLNPGGPGGSGVDFVAFAGRSPIFKALRKRFDLIGFDPRGTNRSTPGIACEPAARTVRRLDRAEGRPVVNRAAVRRALRTGAEYAASCRKASGDLVDLTGTEYAVRDLDLLRAAVGDQKLSYLGFSYGTYLGTVYADLYPTRVRALTLDGSVDPRQYGDDFLGLLRLNARASERSVDAFLAWCSKRPRACTFGDGNAEAAVDGLIRRLDDEPLVTGQGKRRAVTNGYTVAEILYLQTGSGRGAWKDTGQALAGIAAGRPVITNRDLIGAGGATNIAIECTDSAGSVTPAEFRQYALRSARVRPAAGSRADPGAADLRRRQRRDLQQSGRRPTRPATGAATSTPRAQPRCWSWAPRATRPRRIRVPSPWPGSSTAGGSSPRGAARARPTRRTSTTRASAARSTATSSA